MCNVHENTALHCKINKINKRSLIEDRAPVVSPKDEHKLKTHKHSYQRSGMICRERGDEEHLCFEVL